ncbi:annexin B11 [Drosophila persimilis]|nr:annexin B11 [Drosophila persimilis]
MQENTIFPIQQEPTSRQNGEPLHKPNQHYAVGAERAMRLAPPRALPPQAAAQETPRASSFAQSQRLKSLDLNVLHGPFPNQTRMRMPPQDPMQQQTCMARGSMPQGWLNGQPSALMLAGLTVPLPPLVDPENDRREEQAQESLVYGQSTGVLSGRGLGGSLAYGRGYERGYERGLERGLGRGHERGLGRGHERGHGRGHERRLGRGHERRLGRRHERGLGYGHGHGALLEEQAPTGGTQSMLGQDVGVLPGTRHDDNAPVPLLDLNPEFRETLEALNSILFSQYWRE